MAPSYTDNFPSITTRLSSNWSSRPRPSHASQAPVGALKENSLGSISPKVKPETGQANFSENKRESFSLFSSKISTTTKPSDISEAVLRLSASLSPIPSVEPDIKRSTSTSML